MGHPELAYDDLGAGPAVVLIHGHPFNRSMWAPQLAALRGSYRVIAPGPDLRPPPQPERHRDAARDHLGAQVPAELHSTDLTTGAATTRPGTRRAAR